MTHISFSGFTYSDEKRLTLLKSQTCDGSLSYLQDPVADGGSSQQVDVMSGTQHDVL